MAEILLKSHYSDFGGSWSVKNINVYWFRQMHQLLLEFDT